VIAAGAVVTKSFGDGCIIGGVPAKVLRSVHAAIAHPENVRL
jgi:acetyltransferase-like isoleucine patch superfamily enzyme